MLKTKEEIKKWLDKYSITKYTINEDLTVDVDGSVDLYKRKLKSIDVQFGIVKGFFYCHENQLTSLEGCPKYVGLDFACYGNPTEGLDYCPKEIGGQFYCENNPQLGNLKKLTDFNEIKKILDIKKNKEELNLLLKNSNQKAPKKIKI